MIRSVLDFPDSPKAIKNFQELLINFSLTNILSQNNVDCGDINRHAIMLGQLSLPKLCGFEEFSSESYFWFRSSRVRGNWWQSQF